VFGLERGKNSFGPILILAGLALVFFASKGSKKPLRTPADSENKGDERPVEKNSTVVLYSRTLGKADQIPEKKVLEAVDITAGVEEQKPCHILYSRSLGKDRIKGQEEEIQISKEEQPNTETRVYFSRIVKQNREEIKPLKVLYSRSLGKTELLRQAEAEVTYDEERESKAKVHFSRIIKKPGLEEKPVTVLYSRSLGVEKV